MRKTIYFSLVCFYLLTGCASLSEINPQAKSTSNDDLLGFCLGRSLTSQELTYVKDLNSQWIRIDIKWSEVEKEPGNFDFTLYDSFIRECQSNNIKILVVLAYGNHLYNPTHTKNIPTDQFDHYINYCLKTIEHYQGLINNYEIWNEPNIHFWMGDKNDFIQLQKESAQAIKSVFPKITLLNGGLFTADIVFLEKLFQEGAMENIDGIAFHPYSVNSSGVLRQIRMIKRCAERNKFTGNIWITEIGYPTGGLYPSRTSPEKIPLIMEQILHYAVIENIEHVFWYKLRNTSSTRPWNSEDHFGIIGQKGLYSPAALWLKSKSD